MLGNTLEWYDFTMYGYFATVLSAHFFPSESQSVSLIQVYFIFAASYFMRPLGALVFGYIGDKYGRKRSLVSSVMLMAASNIGLAILPTYAQIGIAAPLLLALLRFMQGFAVGGEYSGASIYLIETSPAKRHTFFGSLAVSSAYGGFLLSSLVGTLLSLIFSDTQLSAFGWRFAFAIGGAIALVGYYIRNHLRETEAFTRVIKQHTTTPEFNPISYLLKNHWKKLAIATALGMLPAGLGYIIFVYLSSYLEIYTNHTLQEIFVMNSIMMLFVVISIPYFGYLADKIGRHKFMLISSILILLLSLPIFSLVSSKPLVVMLILGLLNSAYEANIPAELADIFPTQIRYTGLALSLNLAFGIIGGTAPIIATILVNITNLKISPVFYVLFLSLITSIIIYKVYFSKSKVQ